MTTKVNFDWILGHAYMCACVCACVCIKFILFLRCDEGIVIMQETRLLGGRH